MLKSKSFIKTIVIEEAIIHRELGVFGINYYDPFDKIEDTNISLIIM